MKDFLKRLQRSSSHPRQAGWADKQVMLNGTLELTNQREALPS